MQYGLSFVALLEIYAVGGEKSGTWISIGYVVGQIKLPPSFSDLWSQDEVSEDITQVWQRMIQSIYKRKGGEDLRL